MDRKMAEEAYRAATTDLNKALSDRTELDRKVAAATKVIEGLLEYFPNLSPAQSVQAQNGGQLFMTNHPRGKEAVRRILVDQNNHWASIRDLTNEQISRGWADRAKPQEAVRTTVFRMWKAKEVERRKRGNEFLYRLKDLGAPAGKAEAPKSDSLPGDD